SVFGDGGVVMLRLQPAASASVAARARVHSFIVVSVCIPWSRKARAACTMRAVNRILPTTVVGSYPQPGWLIDRAKLGSKVPRVRAPEIWRISKEHLQEAQDDATLLAIRDMEAAGIDIITDGEMRRESYSNRFATALDGVDIDN